jgi:hypothetical protein
MPSFSFDSFASVGAPQSAPVSPALSRSSSVSSITSHKSAPHSTPVSAAGKLGDRSRSVAAPVGASDGKEHGLKHFFSAQGRAERKEKKRLEDEKLSRVVLTSKHAATVKTMLLLEQRNGQRSKSVGHTAGVVGTTQSAHLTAEQQEERLPHSGPPALHTAHKVKERDMPLLTRIISMDEQDDEEEGLRQHRDDWLVKRGNASMEKVREITSSTDDDVVEVLNGQVVEINLTPESSSESRPALRQSRSANARTHFGVWNRNEAGVWTR